MLENKVVNEKRAPEVVFLLLLLLICAGLCKCSGSVGCFYKPINGLEEKQTYQDKK